MSFNSEQVSNVADSNVSSSKLFGTLFSSSFSFESDTNKSSVTEKGCGNLASGYEEIDSCANGNGKPANIKTTTASVPTTTTGLFTSSGFWELKENLFSGISSRLEAALSTPPPIKKQLPIPHSTNWITSKDRSIFGQPEVRIDVVSPTLRKMNRESSHESLDTIDSGHCRESGQIMALELRGLEAHDSLRHYRSTSNNESVGIGSSLESSDVEELTLDECNSCLDRSESRTSIQSWQSIEDSHEHEVKQFMESFVQKMFHLPDEIQLEEKSKFGEIVRSDVGRCWFSRLISEQRAVCKEVKEKTFYSLVQHFAIVLFECSEVDDFTPAKVIMNMSFTYFHFILDSNKQRMKQYVYECLKEQPIWKSLRFWTAAFFDAVQNERAKNYLNKSCKRLQMQTEEEIEEEATFHENITFGQLGTFTYNMKEFGLSKKFCIEFLRKQSTIANLRKEQYDLIRGNIDILFNSEQ